MHEAMVAQSLLAAISAEADKQKARPISATISCGMLNAINDEILAFAFEAIAKGTLCEGTKLEVKHINMQANCKSCSRTFEFELVQPTCPDCGSCEFELSPDAPLTLEEIDFESE